MHIVVLGSGRDASAWLSAALAERLRLPLLDVAGWSVGADDPAGYPFGFVLDGFAFTASQIVSFDDALDRGAAHIDLAVQFTNDGSTHPLVDHYIGRIVEVDGPTAPDTIDRAIERVREAVAAAWHF